MTDSYTAGYTLTDINAPADNVDLRKIFLTILRRKWIIIGTVAAFTMLSIIAVSFLSPRYKAAAALMINPGEFSYVSPGGSKQVEIDDTVVNSEMEFIRSGNIMESVVHELKLQEVFDDDPEDDKPFTLRKAIKELKGRINLLRSNKSNVIHLTGTAGSPELAAEITNAVAQQYLKAKKDYQERHAEGTYQYLTERVKTLKKESEAAARAVRNFRQEHGIVEAAGKNYLANELESLKTQLVMVQSEVAQAEAKLNQAKTGDSKTVIINTRLLEDLKVRESDLLRERANLASKYKSKHPSIRAVNAELGNIRSNIRAEQRRISSELEYNFEVAKEKEKSLQAGITMLEDRLQKRGQDGVILDQLEQEAKTSQAAYTSTLRQLQKNQEERSHHGAAISRNATIITAAMPPLRAYFPNKKAIVGGTIVFSGMIGLMLVFLLEYLTVTYTMPEQIEKSMGLPVMGMMVEKYSKNANALPHDMVLEDLFDPFSESLRSVLIELRQQWEAKESGHTVMITSSIMQEGKTSFTLSLGRIAALSGVKTIVVDMDIRRPSVQRILKLHQDDYVSLQQYAGDSKVKWQDLIVEDEETPLDYICSAPGEKDVYGFLSSKRLETLTNQLAKEYDLVLVDCAPLVPVSDAMVIADTIQPDGLLYMVRWNSTQRSVVDRGLAKLKKIKLDQTGIVMSRTELKRFSQYSYKYQQYHSYEPT